MVPTIIAIVRNHMTRGLVNRWFLVFAWSVLYTATADVFAVCLDLAGPGNAVPKMIAHTAYLLGRACVAPIFVAYLLSRVGLWYRVKNYKRSVLSYMMPTIILSIVIAFVNPFTGIIFYLASGDTYTRGTYMLAMYATSFAYAIAGYILIIKYRKALALRKVVYLLLVFSFALLSTGFQFVFPYLIVECFALAIAVLIIALGIQSPEERFYEHTSILNQSTFSNDLFIARSMDARVSMVIAVTTNYDALVELLSYDAFSQCLNLISSRFAEIRKKLQVDVEFYYLGRGCFALMLINEPDEVLDQLATDTNEFFSKDISLEDIDVRFIANVCLARIPEDITNIKDIIPFAEELKGRDYTGEVRRAEYAFDKREYDIRRNIENIINRAIDFESLYLMYQPIYSVEQERYVAAEGFLRLKDPVYGNIPPLLVIKEAEKFGAVNGLTVYLFEELCRFISGPEFMQLNLEWMEFNLSPVQLNWKDIVSVFVSIMNTYHVNPANVCINIVDEEDVQSYSQMFDNITAFKELGINIYMDDFGAGVFEIERITSMPLDGIKFDREFVRMGIREDAELVLENSVRMIRDMGLDVVAVGVEDLIMRRRLVEMGCTKQQGYYYTKPMTKKEMIRFTVGLPRTKAASGVSDERQVLF